MASGVIRAAAWQCAPMLRQPEANGVRLREAAVRAKGEGARLLVAPELVLTGYDIGAIEPEMLDDAVETVGRCAGESGVAIVAGVARYDEGGCVRNSAVIAGDDGQVLAVHDKTQPFGDLDTRFVPGDQPVTLAEVNGLRVATLICYEVEFPEFARLAALEGADLLAVPTANMEPYHAVHDALVPARAAENALPVVYANHVGVEGSTRYLGRSLLVDGEGVVKACGAATVEEVLVSDLGPGRGTQLRDRRPQLFVDLTKGMPTTCF